VDEHSSVSAILEKGKPSFFENKVFNGRYVSKVYIFQKRSSSKRSQRKWNKTKQNKTSLNHNDQYDTFFGNVCRFSLFKNFVLYVTLDSHTRCVLKIVNFVKWRSVIQAKSLQKSSPTHFFNFQARFLWKRIFSNPFSDCQNLDNFVTIYLHFHVGDFLLPHFWVRFSSLMH